MRLHKVLGRNCFSEACSAAGVEVAQNLATKYEKRQHGVIHPTRVGPDPMLRLQHSSAIQECPSRSGGASRSASSTLGMT